MKTTTSNLVAVILLLLITSITNTGLASDGDNNATNSIVELEENKKPNINEIPYKKDEGYSGASIVRFLFAFVFVVLIALAAVFVLRKYYYGNIPLPKGDSKNINLIETKRLSPKMVVFLLDVQGEQVLLAQCGDNIAFYPQKSHTHSAVSSELTQ